MRGAGLLVLLASTAAARTLRGPASTVDLAGVRSRVLASKAFQEKVAGLCRGKDAACQQRAEGALFCQMLERSRPQLAEQCLSQADGAAAAAPMSTGAAGDAVAQAPASSDAVGEAQLASNASSSAPPAEAAAVSEPVVAAVDEPAPAVTGAFAAVKAKVIASSGFGRTSQQLSRVMGCPGVAKVAACSSYVQEVAFCLVFADKMSRFSSMAGANQEAEYCKRIDEKLPKLSNLLQMRTAPVLTAVSERLERRAAGTAAAAAPEDDLAQEMTHDLEMNFNKIAPFGKEDTAKELQDHAAKTQDTLVDAVENAEVAEIKRAVFRALTRLRAATIKEFDTIARLETQAIDAYNDAHHYRAENPLAHLHEDEAPVETDKLKSFH